MLTAFLQTPVANMTDTTAVAASQAANAELSLFDLTVKGGWLMIPLALLLVIAVVIFVERWLAIRKAAKVDMNFMNSIKDYIHDGKIRAAVSLCQSQNTPVARMIERGIDRIGRPLSDVQTAVENAGNLEVAKLEEGLPFLATIAGGAPMIGFLGTVIGMIQAFFNMSSAGNNIDISLLSGGIYTAMVTTVAGLIVGVMAYFGYNYLVSRVDRVIFKMEASTIEFMDLLNEPVSR
jgi:biopolymer transport protein ExbB